MQNYASNSSNKLKMQQPNQKETPDDKLIALLHQNMHFIVKLQAWARGNRARKQFVFLKSKQIGSAKYFTMAELQET